MDGPIIKKYPGKEIECRKKSFNVILSILHNRSHDSMYLQCTVLWRHDKRTLPICFPFCAMAQKRKELIARPPPPLPARKLVKWQRRGAVRRRRCFNGYRHFFGPSIVLFAARESSQGQKTSPF